MQRILFQQIVSRALEEDLGFGDRTTLSIFQQEGGRAAIEAREEGIIAGLAVAAEVFAQVDGEIRFQPLLQDGHRLAPGARAAIIEGPIRGILTGERVALNFLQRMSGIATATARAVEKVRGTKARITDTRKTAPGLRLLDKYAVQVGGGTNHRFNLSDMVLIKDNHIKGAGSITRAVEKVRQGCGFPLKIEVETTTLEEVREALDCGADVIMLDNMSPALMKEAAGLIGGRALVEASGGIGPEDLHEAAAAGVDLISLGYLTSSVRALDFSLNII